MQLRVNMMSALSSSLILGHEAEKIPLFSGKPKFMGDLTFRGKARQF